MARRSLLLALALLLPIAAGASTTRNDDSCDLALLPAATLLLPWFEVDLDDFSGETTLFTVTNVTNAERIARVTLWTDSSYPVITFNIYLTGYDQQSINLRDVLSRGIIAPDDGTGSEISRRGRYSVANPDLRGDCTRLPGQLDDTYVRRMQSAFTTGTVAAIGPLPACDDVGGVHENAVGYATIDVVRTCRIHNPSDPEYWTEDLAWDNVLAGDYQQVNATTGVAQGGPLVHIRAIVEGGTPEKRQLLRAKYDAGFPRTFYARLQPAGNPSLDGRQPLPSTFAARWIRDAADSDTFLKIWREPASVAASCGDYATTREAAVREIVMFDDAENATAGLGDVTIPEHLPLVQSLPSSSRTSVADASIYPPMASGVTGGWVYLNLDADSNDGFASQAWVVSSMHIGARSTDIDATALGNGCSRAARTSEVSRQYGARIEPARNDAATRGTRATIDNDASCDIAQLPAATLLLPYFEVDFRNPQGERTLFTLTNVGAAEQIARVTLWTDYAVPVISFNVYLTGYDVQVIDLFDVLARGIVAGDEGTGTAVSQRGRYSDGNPGLSLSRCEQLPRLLPAETLERLQKAFTEGTAPDCNNVGGAHDHAVGYATVDIVANCSSNTPLEPAYWTSDIRWDNVLTGDWQQVTPSSAYGSPMVHIRAVPEGGSPSQRRNDPATYDAGFPRTFYARYQPAGYANFDGRQPLPSAFAAHWAGNSQIHTAFRVWREGLAGEQACATNDVAGVPRYTEIVTFDERENAVADFPTSRVEPIPFVPRLPATARIAQSDTSVFPPIAGATSGWIYFNLDSESPFASQNWVVTTIEAEDMAAAFDAIALGNGCSPALAESEVKTGSQVIGPLP